MVATKYWIKLYHETLHDPKVARLSDNLWRRWIECLLFAGEVNEHGRLPPVADMAWVLQKDTELLNSELQQLASLGILQHKTDHVLDDGYWFVVNFGKRQMPLTKKEYMRRLRNKRQNSEHYGDVTNGNTETDKDTDKDKEPEVEAAEVMTFYENNITMLTPYISDTINDWLSASPPSWVMDAMKIAAKNNVRKPRYIEAILDRWHRDGKDDGKKAAITTADPEVLNALYGEP